MTVLSPVTSDVSAPPADPATKVPARGVLHQMGIWSSYVVLVLAALSALIMIVIPLATGSQTYTVLTNSMAPHYAPGTFLVVKPAAVDTLRAGDVITYQIESGKPDVISHRITSVGSTQSGERVFTTKGDNNSLADAATVQEVQIKGKLLYAVPYVGFAAHAAGEQRGTLLPVIAVGFIALGALSMVRGAVESKRGKQTDRDNT